MPPTWLQTGLMMLSKCKNASCAGCCRAVRPVDYYCCVDSSLEVCRQESLSSRTACFTGCVRHASLDVSGMLHWMCPACFTGCVWYASLNVSGMLHWMCPACFTGCVWYASLDVSGMLHWMCLVCFTRCVRHSSPDVSGMYHWMCPACFTGCVWYASLDVSGMLHRMCLVCFTGCVRHASPDVSGMCFRTTRQSVLNRPMPDLTKVLCAAHFIHLRAHTRDDIHC